MQPYSSSIDTVGGSALRNASVAVKLNGVLATIYKLDGTPQANPMTTDSGGRFAFRAANGEYTLEFSRVGIVPRTETVMLYDPADDPSSADALATSGGAALVGAIQSGTGAVTRSVQDKLRESVSVKDFGATGDGSTNDTIAIQKAIDAVVAAGGGRVLFPRGTYMVTSLNVRHGLVLEGDGGATLKRPAGTPNWTRTLTTQNTLWDDAKDSPPLVLRNLVIDGNRDNQGAYSAYQLEQASLVLVTAATNAAGRLRVVLDSCVLSESVSDGIHAVTNVDLQIVNCWTPNCFRGGVVVTGGNTRLRVNGWHSSGTTNARGIDVEIDSPGYGASYDVNVALSNVEVNSFDISVGGNSKVTIDNLIHTNKGFHAATDGAGSMVVNNSTFRMVAGEPNQIRFANDVRFRGCTFVYSNNGVASGSAIKLEVYANTKRRVRFDQCVFEVEAGTVLSDNIYAIDATAGTSADHKIYFTGCSFGVGIDRALSMIQGGYYRFDACYIDATVGVHLVGNTGAECDTWLVNCDYGPNNTANFHQAANNALTKLHVAGQLPASKYKYTGLGGEAWVYASNLVVTGDVSPVTAGTTGKPGDTFKLTTQPVIASGAPVMWVGNRMAGPPYFQWSPVNLN